MSATDMSAGDYEYRDYEYRDYEYRDYEYRGLMAELWDLFRGDTSTWADRRLYRQLIDETGEPVLDVGCGTGRILLDFLQEGLDIDGVDNSPEMLELCRQKAAALGLQPHLYLQWMETLDLPRRYRTILVPSSSFQLLVEAEKAQQAMARFYAHLLPGGSLIMPFMQLWQEGDALDSGWRQIGEKIRARDGALAKRWSRSLYDVETQLEHTQDRYELSINGQVIATEEHRRSPATRSYTQAQVIDLYQAAGFDTVRLLREFTREPASAQDVRLFTAIGRK
jgi:ubiquinone/menaquinone biosynthesis C-methylase UbiE